MEIDAAGAFFSLLRYIFTSPAPLGSRSVQCLLQCVCMCVCLKARSGKAFRSCMLEVLAYLCDLLSSSARQRMADKACYRSMATAQERECVCVCTYSTYTKRHLETFIRTQNCLLFSWVMGWFMTCNHTDYVSLCLCVKFEKNNKKTKQGVMPFAELCPLQVV